MKAGDVVMFTDEGEYSKWFYGQIGTVISCTLNTWTGRSYAKVRWLQCIKYFDWDVNVSSFDTKHFEVIS